MNEFRVGDIVELGDDNPISQSKKKEKRIIKTEVYYDVKLDKTFNNHNYIFPDRVKVKIEKEIEIEV